MIEIINILSKISSHSNEANLEFSIQVDEQR